MQTLTKGSLARALVTAAVAALSVTAAALPLTGAQAAAGGKLTLASLQFSPGTVDAADGAATTR